jgi:hypothetical protein
MATGLVLVLTALVLLVTFRLLKRQTGSAPRTKAAAL